MGKGEDVVGEEEKTNQIFNVREAVPPTDFDAPYSKMPPSVEKLMPRVKQKVIESYKTKINYLTLAQSKLSCTLCHIHNKLLILYCLHIK